MQSSRHLIESVLRAHGVHKISAQALTLVEFYLQVFLDEALVRCKAVPPDQQSVGTDELQQVLAQLLLDF